jgi:hypothetical protein
MTPDRDDLIARLREADPAAALDPRTVPDRAALARARRGRWHGRTLRAGVGGSVLALAGSALLAVGPTGGGGGVAAVVPSVSEVVAQALDASKLPAGSIVVMRSASEVRGAFRQERTTWVRLGRGGERLGVRQLVTSAEGEDVAAGVEDVATRENGKRVLLSYDPQTRAVSRTENAESVPSIALDAHALLRRAQSGDRIVGVRRTTFEGRAAWSLSITGVEEPARRGDRDELIVDAATFEPLQLVKHSEGRDVEGRPFAYDFTMRVLSVRRLPDNAANRAQLELHGPTG